MTTGAVNGNSVNISRSGKDFCKRNSIKNRIKNNFAQLARLYTAAHLYWVAKYL